MKEFTDEQKIEARKRLREHNKHIQDSRQFLMDYLEAKFDLTEDEVYVLLMEVR